MKTVSDAYKSGMKALLRERSYVKVFFENADMTAAGDDGATEDRGWSSNGEAIISNKYFLDQPTYEVEGIATLELNHWELAGKFMIKQNGWAWEDYVSEAISDENGDYETAPVLTREFEDLHSLPGIDLTLDYFTDNYPRELTVVFFRDSEQVDEILFSPTERRVKEERLLDDIDKFEITFGSTLPYHRARLRHVLYGVERVFGNEEIVSCKQNHDVDPLSRRLPIEQFTFTIIDYEHRYDPDNPSALYKYIDINSPIAIQYGYTLADGTVEWLKADRYLLDAKPKVKDDQATFTATGLIGSMTGKYYKGKFYSSRYPLYMIAFNVLNDANLPPSPAGPLQPWYIDESLQYMYTKAVLPVDTHANCLQLIAHAARCRLYTDDDNIIHIEPFGVTKSGLYHGEFTDNGHTIFSNWDTVDKGGDVDYTWVTLELNRWLLDGSDQRIMPILYPGETLLNGYVGSAISGENGVYDDLPLFSRTFDVPHDLRTVSLRFDSFSDEFPRTITVKYYRIHIYPWGLVSTVTVANNRESEVSINNNDATDIDMIEVILDNGLPYRRARVTKAYYREGDFTLNFDTISEHSQTLSKIDQLKDVKVAKTVYTPDTESSDLYEETTTKTQLHVELGCLATDVQITVTGGSMESSEIYGRAVDMVLSSGTKTVKITGKRINESSVVVSYDVADSGETDTEENPLITEDDMSDALAEHVAKYLQMRNTYDADYRGNPELEVGDVIGLQTRYTDEMDALVLTDEITFNGSLRGKIKVKGLI